MNTPDLGNYTNFIRTLDGLTIPLPSSTTNPDSPTVESPEQPMDESSVEPSRNDTPLRQTDNLSTTLSNSLQQSLSDKLDAAKPEAGRTRRVSTIIRNPAWEVFTEKLKTFATFWNRKLLARGSVILSGIFAIAGGYLAYTYMAQRAAAAAIPKSGTPSATASAPNLRTLRYAGAASLLANSITLVEAIPQTVIAIVNIISTIKEGVKIRGEIAAIQKELKELSNPESETSLHWTAPESIHQREFDLHQQLESLNAAYALLPVQGFSAAAIGVISTISLARGTISVAMIALFASSPGKLATVMTLSHVASILGTVAGAIGIVLGGAALVMSGREALNIYRKRNEVNKKIDAIQLQLENTQSNPGKVEALKLELKLLKNQKLELSYNLRHTLITLSSNLMLTFAGVAGLLGTVGIETGVGSLVFGGVALIFVGLSGAISSAHYFYRKRSDEALALDMEENKLTMDKLLLHIQIIKEQIEKGTLTDEDLIPMLPSWNTPEEQSALLNKFKQNPEIYLKLHFTPLVTEIEP